MIHGFHCQLTMNVKTGNSRTGSEGFHEAVSLVESMCFFCLFIISVLFCRAYVLKISSMLQALPEFLGSYSAVLAQVHESH